jgi:hypothetical protein
MLIDIKFCLLFFSMTYVNQSKALVTTEFYHVVISTYIHTHSNIKGT